jgi:hypothetical protein
MVEIVNNIPQMKANMKKIPMEKPRVLGVPSASEIIYSKFSVPQSLNRDLLRKCSIDIDVSDAGLSNREVEQQIEETAWNKNIYIRSAGKVPLSVVTDKFKEIRPAELAAETSRIVGSDPIVRYFQANQSLQMNFPLQTRFKGMYLAINTGPFGVYGGSGKNAVSYGIAWYNHVCANWTVFLNKFLRKDLGRIVHIGDKSQNDSLGQILQLTGDVTGQISESRDKRFDAGQLNGYLSLYETKGLNKKMADAIRTENPRGVSVHDLSYRLTQLCQDKDLSDTTRARIEYMAGEAILCYDQIISGIHDAESERPVIAKRMRREPILDAKSYVLREHSLE